MVNAQTLFGELALLKQEHGPAAFDLLAQRYQVSTPEIKERFLGALKGGS